MLSLLRCDEQRDGRNGPKGVSGVEARRAVSEAYMRASRFDFGWIQGRPHAGVSCSRCTDAASMLADPSAPAEWMRGACAETALPPACPYRPILRRIVPPSAQSLPGSSAPPLPQRSEDVIGSSVADMLSQTRSEAGAGATWLGWRGSGVDVGHPCDARPSHATRTAFDPGKVERELGSACWQQLRRFTERTFTRTSQSSQAVRFGSMPGVIRPQSDPIALLTLLIGPKDPLHPAPGSGSEVDRARQAWRKAQRGSGIMAGESLIQTNPTSSSRALPFANFGSASCTLGRSIVLALGRIVASPRASPTALDAHPLERNWIHPKYTVALAPPKKPDSASHAKTTNAKPDDTLTTSIRPNPSRCSSLLVSSRLVSSRPRHAAPARFRIESKVDFASISGGPSPRPRPCPRCPSCSAFWAPRPSRELGLHCIDPRRPVSPRLNASDPRSPLKIRIK
ncbi:hypothetical protein L1887_46925 [Cichorium endivia]|nr:hypothetical protein L1887_46925 [Cichorium endivia]